MISVAILISGGGSNMETLLDSMHGDHPARPCVVVSNDPNAGGLAKATARGVPTAIVDHKRYPDRPSFEAALQDVLVQSGAQVVCLAGFMRVLTAGFVEPWTGRMLNIHPSLLPKHKGLNTHARAIDAGDTNHGCTVHLVTPELDDGPILGQATVPVFPTDTTDALAARVLTEEHRLYPRVLREFCETLPPVTAFQAS